jgi:hypothetical protein
VGSRQCWRFANGEWKAADAPAPFTLYLVPFALKAGCNKELPVQKCTGGFFEIFKSLNFEILKLFLRQPPSPFTLYPSPLKAECKEELPVRKLAGGFL